MYAIILTILICLIIILVFNNNFEPFGLNDDLNEQSANFSNENTDDGSGSGSGSGSSGGDEAIPAPNTDDSPINTKYTINLPRICRSTECNDRLIRWGQESDGEFQIIPTTFKKIINKIKEIN